MSQKADKSARRPAGAVRRACFALVTSRPFDFFITGVVVANIGAMACDYFGIQQDVRTYYYYSLLMSAFSYTYYCEAALKITGLGPVAYFRDGWCRFDFFLVVVSVLDQCFSEYLQVPPLHLPYISPLYLPYISVLLRVPAGRAAGAADHPARPSRLPRAAHRAAPQER